VARRRAKQLGSPARVHRERAKTDTADTISTALSSAEASRAGDCTRGFDLLVGAHTAYGRMRAEVAGKRSRKMGNLVREEETRRRATGALMDARDEFRRRCVVKS
jgi:hypothetical protein